jgi:hypothetical protein
MYSMISVQYGNSVVLQRKCPWMDWGVKNGRTKVKQEEGTGPATEGNGAYVAYLLVEIFFLRAWRNMCDDGPKYIEKQGSMLENDVRYLHF